MNPEILLLVHAAATWAMVGLIWFVQIVHYALFPEVGAAGFARYEDLHTRRTTLVVLPLMAAEAAAALALLATLGDAWTWTGAGLLALVWASTAVLQVPCHGRLARGFDASTARRLVRTNWIRTLGWSGRGLVAGLLCAEHLGAVAA
jgi:hypothetical protein